MKTLAMANRKAERSLSLRHVFYLKDHVVER
jgi:hypothetical protein